MSAVSGYRDFKNRDRNHVEECGFRLRELTIDQRRAWRTRVVGFLRFASCSIAESATKIEATVPKNLQTFVIRRFEAHAHTVKKQLVSTMGDMYKNYDHIQEQFVERLLEIQAMYMSTSAHEASFWAIIQCGEERVLKVCEAEKYPVAVLNYFRERTLRKLCELRNALSEKALSERQVTEIEQELPKEVSALFSEIQRFSEVSAKVKEQVYRLVKRDIVLYSATRPEYTRKLDVLVQRGFARIDEEPALLLGGNINKIFSTLHAELRKIRALHH